MAVNAFTYVKNVGRSLGYSAIDVFKEYNPAVNAGVQGAKEFSSDLYQSIQDFKETISSRDESNFAGKTKGVVHDLWTNLIEDAKSGNWYNKARSEKHEEAMMFAMMGLDGDDNPFDFDFDDAFDFDDDGEDVPDVDFEEESTKVTIESERENTSAMINAMDAVASKSSTAIGMATAQSAQYVVEANRETARVQQGMNMRGIQQLSTGLAAIEASVSSLVSLGEPLTTHMQNASTFFVKSTELQQQMLEHLANIAKNTAPIGDSDHGKRKTSMEDLLDEGVLNLSSYADFVKENITKGIKEAKDMADMLGGFDGIAQLLTGSPMKIISDQIVRLTIPKTMKDSMKDFNETLSNFFLGGMNKLQKKDWSEYGLLGQMFEMGKGFFLPSDQYTTSVSTGSYNKGKVNWDGASRKSILEVIPTQLAHIEAALTGGPVMLYDYDRGKFVSHGTLKKEAKETKQRYANRAGGDFRDDLRNIVTKSGANRARQEEVKDQIDAFFLHAFEKGIGFEEVLDESFRSDQYGIDNETLELIRNTIKSYGKNGKTSRGLGFASGVRSEREAYGRRMRGLAENGLDSELYLYNDSDKFGDRTKAGGVVGKDEYNHDIFYYLQGIYQYTGHLSDNIMIFGAGGAGGRYHRRDSITTSDQIVPVRDIRMELTDAQIREQQESIERQERATADRDYRYTMEEIDAAVTGTRPKKKKENTTEEATKKEHGEEEEDKPLGDALKRMKEMLEERAELSGDRPKRKGKIGKFQETVNRIFQAPAKIAADMLDATEASMYRLIFGQDASDEPGIFDYFYTQADKIFTRVDKFFEEKMGISLKETTKNLWTKFVGENNGDEYEGGIASGIANGFKNAMGSVKEFLVGSFIDDFGTKVQRRKRRMAKEGTEEEENTEATETEETISGSDIVNEEADKINPPSDTEGENTEEEKKENTKKKGKRKAKGRGRKSKKAAKKQRASEAAKESAEEPNPEDLSPIDQAAEGRRVTKTGLIAVSEGELVIPSELNPFYHGTTNKKKQKRDEASAIRNFYGAYNEGRTVADKGDDGKGETKEESGFMEKNITDFFIEGGRTLGNGAVEFFKQILQRDKKEEKKDNEVISKVTRDIFKDHGETVGTMAAGAIIGGGVSLLTGFVLGPLAGAAIGAGVAMSIKSGEMQKLLFGEEGEDGKRRGGLLNDKITKLIHENVPDMAKGGAIGLAGGLFLGSPVLGAFLGATIGYVKSSEEMKDKIFGKLVDGKRLGGWIPRTLQEKIKEAAPNIGAGIIAGMVAGPFGILPNIMLGGALGYVSSTEDFKDKIFGKVGEDGKRQGGIVSELRKKLFGDGENDGLKQWFEKGFFEPARGIMQKLGNELKIHGKSMWKTLGKTLRKAMVNVWESEAAQRLKRSRIGKAVGAVGKFAGKVAKTPFNLASGVLKRTDEALERRALERGYNLYDNEAGRWMTAEERQRRRNELFRTRDLLAGPGRRDRMQNQSNFDDLLIGKSPEELRKIQEELQLYNDPTKIFDEQIRDRGNALSASLDDMASAKLGEGKGLEDKEIVKLLKAAKKGKVEDFDKILSGSNLTDEQKSAIKEKLDAVRESQDARKFAKDNKDVVRDKLNMRQNFLTKFGFDISDGNLDKFNELLNAQIQAKTKTPEELEEEAEQKKQEEQDQMQADNHDNVETIRDSLDSIDQNLSDISKLMRGEEVPEHEEKDDEEDKKSKTAKDVVNEEAEKVEGDKGLDDGNENVISQYDNVTGEITQLVRGRNGDLEPNLGDSGTRRAMEAKQKFLKAIYAIPMLGGAIKGVGGIIGSFKDKLIGEGDGKKKGLLSKLFDKAKNKLFGEDGYISGLFHHFTQSKIGEKVSTVLGRVSVAEIAGTAVIAGLAYGAATGKLNSFFEEISKRFSFLKGNDTGATIANNSKEFIDGAEVQRDEEGNIIKNDEGQILGSDGNYHDGNIDVYGHNDSAQAGFWKNTIFKSLSKKGSVATAAAAKVGNFGLKLMGKEASLNGANVVSKVGAKGVEVGTKIGAGIMTKINDLLTKLPGVISKIPFMPSSVINAAPEFCKAIYTHLDDAVKAIASKGGKLLSTLGAKISKIMPWVIAANAVQKGLDAWTGGAASILGIVDEPTTGQKIIACIIAVVNALIPIVGDLIPDKILVNIMCDIGEKVGIDVFGLREQREAAEALVAEENAKNGTNLTVEQYNEMNGRVGIVKGTLNRVKGVFANIKEQGLKQTAINYATEKADLFKESYAEGGVGEALATTVQNVIDDIIPPQLRVGDLAGNVIRIYDKIRQGDVSGVMKSELLTSDESSGILVKTVNTLLGGLAKIGGVPLALVFKGFNAIAAPIAEKAKKLFDNAKQVGSNIIRAAQDTESMINDPESTLGDFLDFSKYNVGEDNTLGFINKVAVITSRVMMTGHLVMNKIGKDITKVIMSIVGKVKDTVLTTINTKQDIFSKALEGDIGGMWATSGEEEGNMEGNPLGFIVKTQSFTTKLIMTPIALVSKIGHGIGGWFKDNIGDPIEKSKSKLQTAMDQISAATDAGDLKGVLSVDTNFGEDAGPVGGFLSFALGIHKGFSLLGALFSKITNFVKDNFGFIFDGLDWLGEKAGDIAGNIKDTFAEKFDGVYQSGKKWLTGGDSGIDPNKSASSGPADTFVSQLDTAYANVPYSNSTIGEIGCAPAAATMLANQVNPGSLTMDSAIQAAQPYSDTNGTSADYFGDVLSKSGVAASYLNQQNDITTALKSGRPTVLLGQNINNHDKEASPFGPNKHFVVARYMDANGNIVVDDPESNEPGKTYNSSILNNVSLGVSSAVSNMDGDPLKGSGESGGTADFDTPIAQNVWGYLTSKGYSPEAAAGILGNMRQESGVDPTRTQSGNQAAAGIVQWQHFKNQDGRWKAMADYAASKGKDWTDLQSQLEFLNAEVTGDGSVPGADTYSATLFAKRYGGSAEAFKQVNDLGQAVKDFEECFERAGKPELDKRLNYAKEYYSLYDGSEYTGTFDSESGSVDAKNGEAGAETDQTKSGSTAASVMGLSGILSFINSTFSNMFNPTAAATTGLAAAATGAISSNSDSANGEYAVNPNATGGPGTEDQNSLVGLLKSKLGQLQYSMEGPRDPEKGSADCSSTVNWAYKKVYGKDIGNNTESILSSPETEVVDMAENMDQSTGGKNGSGPHLDKLQPGDLMLYSRPDSGYASRRPYRVGHVEMYAGEGQRIGHGGRDPGPKLSDATKDAGRYIMAKRLKGVSDSSASTEAGAGSKILDKLEAQKYTGGSSGLTSSLISTPPPTNTINRLLGNNTSTESTGDEASATPPVSASGDSGVAAALQTLIGLVQSIVSNTSAIPGISNTLTNYCGAQVTTDVQEAAATTGAAAAATEAADAASNGASSQPEDPGLQDLMDTLNIIASS